MSEEKSYVIGTHDAEIERLGTQHRVWRASVLDLWRLGGITTGQTVLDVGAGPGYAALELAEIVGRNGKVIAVERSRRFLDALSHFAAARGLANIEPVEADLLEYDWPQAIADRAWCRWVLAFVERSGEGAARHRTRAQAGRQTPHPGILRLRLLASGAALAGIRSLRRQDHRQMAGQRRRIRHRPRPAPSSAASRVSNRIRAPRRLHRADERFRRQLADGFRAPVYPRHGGGRRSQCRRRASHRRACSTVTNAIPTHSSSRRVCCRSWRESSSATYRA